MMMSRLPFDVIWLILHHLPSDEIVYSRQVCCLWKSSVDNASIDDWRHLYCMRVCGSLLVGPNFNWMKAAVNASGVSATIVAICMWHNVLVRLSAPWVSTDTVNGELRDGVVRSENDFTHVIDYIYENTFRLRCLGRSCLQRQASDKCLNCRNKRQCLFMEYDYYLRPIDFHSQTLDECLGRHLCTFQMLEPHTVNRRRRQHTSLPTPTSANAHRQQPRSSCH